MKHQEMLLALGGLRASVLRYIYVLLFASKLGLRKLKTNKQQTYETALRANEVFVMRGELG